jgi:pentatricopeptide repeat protein
LLLVSFVCCLVQTYGPIVHALVRDGQLDKAFAVLDEMQAKNLVCPEVYLKLLRERCRVRRVALPPCLRS